MKSKVFFLTFAILFLLSTVVLAKPVIKADDTYFDVSTGLYVLTGNVYIEANNRVITAGQAKVNPVSMEVWGSGGITVTQDDIYFTGDTVHVYGSQEKAEIDGGVTLARNGLKIIADRVTYMWRDRLAVFTGNVQITQDDKSWTADSVNYNMETNSFQ